MRKVILLSVAAVAIFSAPLLWPVTPARADGPAMDALVDGNTSFALDLYGQLKRGKGNLFLSPYSISTALAMTHAGARGDTAKQMSEVLHFTLDKEELPSAFGHLEARLNGVREKGNIELRVANALWADQDYRFLDEFLELVTRNYKADLRYADFKTAYEAAREEINAWVEGQTNGKIKDLLERGVLDSLTRLVLANAIYFKGMWMSQFEKSATKDLAFWLTHDSTIDVPMMSQELDFNYLENAEVQVLELPYAGNDLSMIILLPRKIDGLAELEASLTAENLRVWLASLQKRRVMVYVPRFRMTTQFSLGNTLKLMGMPNPFQPGIADFSGIDGTRMLYISAVIHKAFVDVNEEGSEAAAATGVVIGLTSVPAAPTEFRADHPFVFLIREKASGSILFLGRLVDPTG